MPAGESHVNERLDHLIMAGSERWIGLAAWLDEQDPTNQKPSERRDGKEARMKCPHCEQVRAEKGA